MKRILSVLLIVILAVSTVSSHPASKVILKYDKVEQVLRISVMHSVKDTDKHYIELVTVKVNDKE